MLCGFPIYRAINLTLTNNLTDITDFNNYMFCTQAQSPESIAAAQTSLSLSYRVGADGLGRAAVLRGVLNIDIYNSIAAIRAAYITLSVRFLYNI
jgi:hypothetical protein